MGISERHLIAGKFKESFGVMKVNAELAPSNSVSSPTASVFEDGSRMRMKFANSGVAEVRTLNWKPPNDV